MSKEHNKFLTELESAGVCTAFTAIKYLTDQYPMDNQAARKIIIQWVNQKNDK
tara:strand:- start:700 stop:858 length:159 start_codon:yes stop_codon:yes gene_type:complete